MTDLPPAIQAFVDRTNAGDAEGVAACFTENAELTDWGRRFRGREGVAAWDGTDNTGVQSRMQVLDWHPSDRGYLVTIRVSGNGFNGVGKLDFAVTEGKLRELVIA